MIKAIFFDIDGTLVSFESHRMSDRLKECLDKLRAIGVKLFISSGRHVLVMNNLDSYPFDGYIAMNGALTILEGKTIDSRPLPKDISSQVARIAGEVGVPCWSFADSIVGINFENGKSEEVSRQLNFFPEHYLDLDEVAHNHEVGSSNLPPATSSAVIPELTGYIRAALTCKIHDNASD